MKAKVNGIEIYYELHGSESAPWLVLSHSLACSVRMWDPQQGWTDHVVPHGGV